MKRLEITCDGCDLVEHANLSDVREPTFLVAGWVSHRIVAIENDLDPYELKADLCPKCSENLRRIINPSNWPRLKSASIDNKLEAFQSLRKKA